MIEGRYAVEGYQAAFVALVLVQLAVYAVLLRKERVMPVPQARVAQAPGTRAFKGPRR